MLKLKYEYSNKVFKNKKWELKSEKIIEIEKGLIEAVDNARANQVKLVTNSL